MKTTSKWRRHQKWRWPKNEDDLENLPPLQIFTLSPSPPHEKNTWTFSWWLLTLTAIPQLMLNRKRYQVSKPEMEFRRMNSIYTAFPMRVQTEKTTYSALRYFSPFWSPLHGSKCLTEANSCFLLRMAWLCIQSVVLCVHFIPSHKTLTLSHTHKKARKLRKI